MLVQKVRSYGRLIKFSHTVFALPFALAAVVLAHRQQQVTFWNLLWIIIAMAAARSAAMGFNRIADYDFDRRNPRTATRPLVSGEIDKKSALTFICVSSAVFVLSAAALGKLCFMLSFPVLFVLFFYSLTKRFTHYAHIFLGFAIGLAPAGAWVAATGSLDWRILLLSMALMSYIAGFDILYSCQDIEFDRSQRLFSMPANWGVDRALRFSSLLHVLTFLSLLSLSLAFNLSSVYLFFLFVISLLLVLEHRLVRPGHLEQINLAFFHVNSAVSILLFLGILTDSFFA